MYLSVARKRGWLGVIGLIAAYAFVLQSLLALNMASAAVAQAASADSLFVICASHNGQATTDSDSVPTHNSHTQCPICTAAAHAAVALPEQPAVPARLTVGATATFVAQRDEARLPRSNRAGLSRAPPQSV